MYKADTWKYAQRVIVKKEVNEKGKNVHYIVTNFQHGNSRFLYREVYGDRGRMGEFNFLIQAMISARSTLFRRVLLPCRGTCRSPVFFRMGRSAGYTVLHPCHWH